MIRWTTGNARASRNRSSRSIRLASAMRAKCAQSFSLTVATTAV